jgi:methylated-DNA-[protein]-cysteine S-methyltransferase
MTTTFFTNIESPLGPLFVQGDGQFVTGLFMREQSGWLGPEASWQNSDAALVAAAEQLAEYFAGERQAFDVPLRLVGTAFQQRVWRELVKIPFGTTIAYAELARRVGRPTASRAVGHANGRNPISIIIPCHRVVGADGTLTGYAGGLEKKQWLLDFERQTKGSSAVSIARGSVATVYSARLPSLLGGLRLVRSNDFEPL